MSVKMTHVVMFGVKLPYIKIEDNDFADFINDNHGLPRTSGEIDPDKIYVLSDNYCSGYTVVGYIYDMTDEYTGFDGFVHMSVQHSDLPIVEFLWQEGFGDVIPDGLPQAEWLIFTYAS